MSDALTKEGYDAEIEEIAERLVDEARDDPDLEPEQAVMEWVGEELDYHNWFARDYYDGALYGSIVDHTDADVGRYSDWQALIEANEPMETLKRLAYVCMEADVIETAHGLLDGE